ncbi:MAG TPA: GIY-YIG nuclease family protein [Actinomycetota bacterium]|nr:GIY-YIG nuclease family protein [Actinomycetota bacterium]
MDILWHVLYRIGYIVVTITCGIAGLIFGVALLVGAFWCLSFIFRDYIAAFRRWTSPPEGYERHVIWSSGGVSEPTHVYHFYDRQGRLLYVGITNDLKRRWAQHEADKPWWHLVARKESVQYPTREEAERVEEHQIRTHRPMFNRAMNGWLSPRG